MFVGRFGECLSCKSDEERTRKHIQS